MASYVLIKWNMFRISIPRTLLCIVDNMFIVWITRFIEQIWSMLMDIFDNQRNMAEMFSSLAGLELRDQVIFIIRNGLTYFVKKFIPVKIRYPASLAFVRGIHRWPVNSLPKRPVTRKVFPFDDVIMIRVVEHVNWYSTIFHIFNLTKFFSSEDITSSQKYHFYK